MQGFENQADYSAFLSWLDGSCLAQRMSLSVDGGVWRAPEHWAHFATLRIDWPELLPNIHKA